MTVTITSIKTKLSSFIARNEEFKNVTVSCVIKKVNSYDYKTYIDIVDPNNETISINATISATIYKNDINVGDKLLITANVTYYRDVSLCIKTYKHEIADISNYEKVLTKLKDNQILQIPHKVIPNVITNIAIISSAHASGLKDFLDVITSLYLCNVYIFHITLQGKFMEEQFLNAMKNINNYNVDATIIIRGGGAKIDLEWFDNYNIAKSIKLSKIPVICGIGHETDLTIVDSVADKSCTTPTQVSYFIKSIVSKQNALLSNIKINISNILLSLNTSLLSIDMSIKNYALNQKDHIKDILNKVNSEFEIKYNSISNIYNDKSCQLFHDNLEKNIIKTESCKKLWKNVINKSLLNLNEILESQTVMILNETTDNYIKTKEDFMNAKHKKHKICIHFMDGTIYI